VTRSPRQRLRDIRIACEAVEKYAARDDVERDLVHDAMRVRLIEIGEAVKDLAPTLLASEPTIPWAEIARMRDQLAHRYFDTAHSIVRATALNDIPLLHMAVLRISQQLDDGTE